MRKYTYLFMEDHTVAPIVILSYFDDNHKKLSHNFTKSATLLYKTTHSYD